MINTAESTSEAFQTVEEICEIVRSSTHKNPISERLANISRQRLTFLLTGETDQRAIGIEALYTLAESDNQEVQRKVAVLDHLYSSEPDTFFDCVRNFSKSESGLIRLIAMTSMKRVFEKYGQEWSNPEILDFTARFEGVNAAFEENGGLNAVLANRS